MSGEHILVIDDCQTVRELVGDILVEYGYSCDLAEDGQTGLDHARQRTPDLVLLDFIMPRMNGFQFMQSFRASAETKNVPVVLVSVKADSMGEKFMRATGAADALTKPFSSDGLVTVVQHCLMRAADREGDGDEERHPYLSADRFEPEHVRDAQEQSREAMERIRNILVDRLSTAEGESPDRKSIESILDDEFLVELHTHFKHVDPTAGVAAFAGSTDAVSVGEVMQLLIQDRSEGTLEIQGEGMQANVFITRGRVALARLIGGPDEFLLGRYFLKKDAITREELRRLLEQPQDGTPLGEKLIRMGYINREDLDESLTEQTTEVLYEMLRWQGARYRFLPGKLSEEVRDLNLQIPVGELLMEGLRRVDEWRLIQRHIPDFDLVPSRTPGGLEALKDDTALSAEETRVLDYVNGTRSVREIIRETRMSSFEVSKILYQLFTMKVVRTAEKS